MRHPLRRITPERVLTWWHVGRKDGILCLSYGGTMTNGRVRVCEKRRGHFDSHAYEFLDVLEAKL
jgi:hypothetical protein